MDLSSFLRWKSRSAAPAVHSGVDSRLTPRIPCDIKRTVALIDEKVCFEEGVHEQGRVNRQDREGCEDFQGPGEQCLEFRARRSSIDAEEGKQGHLGRLRYVFSKLA